MIYLEALAKVLNTVIPAKAEILMAQFILRLGRLFLFTLRITPKLCPIN